MKTPTRFSLSLLLLLSYLGTAKAWSTSSRPSRFEEKVFLSSSNSQSNRREFWTRAGVSLVGIWVPSTAMAAPPKKIPPYIQERGSLEAGLGPCPGQPMKKSCWSSEDTEGRRVERWEPPASLKGDPAIIAKELEETMAAYPQEGQNDVDRGGWIQAERNTEGKATYLRYEFTSGKFKYIDELELLVDASGKVSVRTASRNAGFDYNVNGSRINYIQKALQRKGWKVKLV